jgi:hypothetical protein
MMKRDTTTDSKIHELTTAEIGRQIGIHTERRQHIINERAATYANALKNGGFGGDTVVVDADERAAREHAKNLLNGSAPESLSLPPEITRDRMLIREMRGIDIALKILTDKNLVARAAEAVEWAEANGDRWRAFCREITLTAIKLEALEDHARRLLGGCGDLFAVRLPMPIIANNRSVSEIPISSLTEAALAEGVVTSAEIRKAQNVS